MFFNGFKSVLFALGLSGAISGEVFYLNYMNEKSKDVKVVLIKKSEKTKEFNPLKISFKDNADGKNKIIIFDLWDKSEDSDWFLEEEQHVSKYRIKKWQKSDNSICKYNISDDEKFTSLSISENDQAILNEFFTNLTLNSINCQGISVVED